MVAFLFSIIAGLLCAGILGAANVRSSPCPRSRMVRVEAGDSKRGFRCVPRLSCAVLAHLWLHVDPTEAVAFWKYATRQNRNDFLSILLRAALVNPLVFH